jgi:hypothetical protein
MNDVSERMEFLERRYHELHHETRVARSDLSTGGVDAETRRALEGWLDGAEQEQRAILREIEMIEDSLLEDLDWEPSAAESQCRACGAAAKR